MPSCGKAGGCHRRPNRCCCTARAARRRAGEQAETVTGGNPQDRLIRVRLPALPGVGRWRRASRASRPGRERSVHKNRYIIAASTLSQRDKIARRTPAQAAVLAALPRLTEEEIEARRSSRSGWTREQLAKWGVPWLRPQLGGRAPPPCTARAAGQTRASGERPARAAVRRALRRIPVLLEQTGTAPTTGCGRSRPRLRDLRTAEASCSGSAASTGSTPTSYATAPRAPRGARAGRMRWTSPAAAAISHARRGWARPAQPGNRAAGPEMAHLTCTPPGAVAAWWPGPQYNPESSPGRATWSCSTWTRPSTAARCRRSGPASPTE